MKDIKETIKWISIANIIVIAIVGIITFIVWISQDPFDWIKEPLPEPIYTYTWSQCFDNDNENFSQEYADRVANEAEKDNPGGKWIRRGQKDIIGCGGDLFYQYVK